jgi:hypothetical protein
MSNICEIVRKMEQDYTSGSPTTLSKYVEFDQYENINKVDAYANSKHISGDTDAQGREKPFFNIVTAAINIWYRATDIDRKNILVKPTNSKTYIQAIIGTIKLQDWMRKTDFGQFLNNWGYTLAKYGSAVSKFVEKDGQLYPEVISWHNLICDPINFEDNPKIEKLELTPAQLKRKEGYDKEMVESLLDALENRKTLDGNNKDNKSDHITLYEIHGNLEKEYLTGKEDDEEYVQQMQVVSFVAGKENGDYDDFVLYKGREKQDPYMITSLIKEDNRVMGKGAVENLFEAQWMENHTAKTIKDQLDLASKLIFQTSDTNYLGRNVLTDIQNGNIMVHKVNEPLTQINNNSHDITSLQNFGSQWKVLANEINGISESMQGDIKSGTAWRQTEAVLAESHSLFELMTENKGLAIAQMVKKFIIPYFKKTLDTKEEISAMLDDQLYIPKEIANRTGKELLKKVLEDNIPEQEEIDQMNLDNQNAVTGELSRLGNQRFLVPDEDGKISWKEYFKDLEWDIEVDVTGEAKDTQSVLATLTTVLQTIGSNPAILQDSNARMLFNKIISETGAISPLELKSAQTSQPVSGGQQVGGELEGIGKQL